MLLLKLSWNFFKKNKLINILSIIVFFILFTSLSIISWLGDNIEKNIILQEIGEEKNKVIISQKNKNILENIFYNNQLNNLYNKIKDDKEFKEIKTIYKFNIASSAELSFLGFNFKTDVFLFASNKLTGNKLKIGFNPLLINLYNSQLADGNLFPRINKNLLKKIKVKIIFGNNSFFKNNKTKELNGEISSLDVDFPILGISINKNIAENLVKELGYGKLELYKLVIITNNYSKIIEIKKKYGKYFKIESYNDKLNNVKKKVKYLIIIFNIIKYLIILLVASFIILLIKQLINENSYTIRVLYYNGANKLKQFSIIFHNVSIYIILSSIISLGSIFLINKNIEKFSKYIEEKGIIGIKIEKVSYQETIKKIILIYLILIISGGLFFLLRGNK